MIKRIKAFFSLFDSNTKNISQLYEFYDDFKNIVDVNLYFNTNITDHKIYIYHNKLYFKSKNCSHEFYPISLTRIPYKTDSNYWVIGYFVESQDLIFTEDYSILCDRISKKVFTCYQGEWNMSESMDTLENFLNSLREYSEGDMNV